MTTSWNETQQIEAVMIGAADPGDVLLFEAKLLIDHELAEKVIWQNKAYQVIKQYGRKRLKEEVEAVHQELFNEPQHRNFNQKIKRIFSKH